MSLPVFERHTKEWFFNRVGEPVSRAYTVLTPQSERTVDISSNTMVIATEKHAEAVYSYHVQKKVNFYQTQIKTK